MTPPIEVEGATTPPILSSSPGIDAMDISPLPHKPPYFVAQVTLPSPTPDQTPEVSDEVYSDILSSEAQLPAQVSQPAAPTFLQLPEYASPLK